ncbi:cupin [Pseudoalteromonas sp. A25]|uniref:AraC family transcriptional regulator n=1 Tax=Pseudoalteromonas sp. A25 TaxID=116092 RepID=UPI0012611E73|nr:AraC family transcriptional regulator [Pseudoalteromonas sp. A25]BBN80336.1 cupin [Pseudoalteromonas sp. A25]
MNFDYKKRTSTRIDDSPIGKLLHSLRMESAFFTNSTFTRPWAVGMPCMPNCMMFHLIVEGCAHFEVGDSHFQLNEGDFVLFPKGEGHILSDGTCTLVKPLAELPIQNLTARYETLNFGGAGARSKLICGAMLFEHPLAIKLLGILPSFIRIDSNADESLNMVKSISELLKTETQNISVGAEAVIARLADILVIAAMRQYLTELSDDKLGWLSALEDERVGKALKLIHEKPDKHWSLEELACEVAMSRTSFAVQFKRLVGNTPMDYLTEWRMSLAYSRLQMSKDTVLCIALDTGYQSEASFSRAFKKVTGKTPGEVRKA